MLKVLVSDLVYFIGHDGLIGYLVKHPLEVEAKVNISVHFDELGELDLDNSVFAVLAAHAVDLVAARVVLSGGWVILEILNGQFLHLEGCNNVSRGSFWLAQLWGVRIAERVELAAHRVKGLRAEIIRAGSTAVSGRGWVTAEPRILNIVLRPFRVTEILISFRGAFEAISLHRLRDLCLLILRDFWLWDDCDCCIWGECRIFSGLPPDN